MNRLLAVAVFAASLFVGACGKHQELLPPGEDPDALARAITLRGQGEAPPVEEVPLGSPLMTNIVAGAALVCGIIFLVPVGLAYLYLKARTNSAAIPLS